MGTAAKISGCQQSLQANELRRRFGRGDNSITSESWSMVRKQQTLLNKTFARDFSSKLNRFSTTEGGLIYCFDLNDFTYLYVWIRGKSVNDVRLIKLNGNDGQLSLKLMVQFIYDNDQIFAAYAHLARSATSSSSLLDTDVRRTYILALIHGGTEIHESVAFLYFSVVLHLLQTNRVNATIVILVDMKFSNALKGLQTHGSSHSYLWTMFSRFVDRSYPDTLRTVDSINSHAIKYVAAAAAALQHLDHPSQWLDLAGYNSTKPLRMRSFWHCDLSVFLKYIRQRHYICLWA